MEEKGNVAFTDVYELYMYHVDGGAGLRLINAAAPAAGGGQQAAGGPIKVELSPTQTEWTKVCGHDSAAGVDHHRHGPRDARITLGHRLFALRRHVLAEDLTVADPVAEGDRGRSARPHGAGIGFAAHLHRIGAIRISGDTQVAGNSRLPRLFHFAVDRST